MNGDAVNCRFQLRNFQKLYNADPQLVEWKVLDPLDVFLVLLGVLSLLFYWFLEIQASSCYPNSAEYPNGNQSAESKSRDTYRKASKTQCMVRTSINTSKYMPGD